MCKWLLNAKKIKHSVSTCDTNDITDNTESCANEAGTNNACSMIPVEQLPKNDDGYFPKLLDNRYMSG
jgi:hypothetical protein